MNMEEDSIVSPASPELSRIWPTLFRIVSMDCAAPYLADMGLHLAREEQIRIIVRASIVDHRALGANDPRSAAAFPEETLRRVADALDSESAEDLQAWASMVANFEETGIGNQVFLWSSLLKRAVFSRFAQADLSEPFPVVERRDRFQSEMSEYYAREREVRNGIEGGSEPQNLSPWDFEIEHRNAELSGTIDERVSEIADRNLFLDRWQRAVSGVDDSGLDRLFSWAKERAEGIGMPTDILEHPSCFSVEQRAN